MRNTNNPSDDVEKATAPLHNKYIQQSIAQLKYLQHLTPTEAQSGLINFGQASVYNL